MREFRDGAAWTSSAVGFRCESELFESVREGRPKQSTWRPGAGPDQGHAEGAQLPVPELRGEGAEPAYERFAANPVSDDRNRIAARFRAIAGSEPGSGEPSAAERLDAALRRLKSERS